MLVQRLSASAHQIDGGQERRLGLDVVHVLGVTDPGILHRQLDGVGDLLDHRRTADILGLQLDAERGADREARLRGRAGLVVAGKHGGMRGKDAVAAAGPHHRDVVDLGLGALAMLRQHAAERLVGEDAGEIVDAAIALGLADHGDDLVGGELAGLDQILDAAGVLHCLEFDLRHFDRHGSPVRCRVAVSQGVRCFHRILGRCSPRSIFS